MKLRFPMVVLAAMTLFAGLPAAVSAEEASPGSVTNLSVPAKVPVRFAPAQEIVQDIAAKPEPADDAVDPTDADYATLAAAVAAQPATIDDEELNCVAIGVYYESKGEPLTGQLAVADVILNRTKSGRFPASACGVLTQRSQFSFVKGGRLPDVDTSRPAWKTAVAIARIARNDLWKSPAEGALFFHARRVSPNWGKTRVASLGNHIFYR
ncbi:MULTISPECIES: cell wall hydrolase [Sphingomonas]|jgi:spore germination cell wall hydrolase CwlJ-like protein|nr:MULTISPECIES: cell wall hydrolase [Sphingomonas]PZT94448.1 MAG: cell wall hydrolase [Sphingomonas sp.]WCP72468.1 cell wall hydrolase [Sphingomonas hankookensis]